MQRYKALNAAGQPYTHIKQIVAGAAAVARGNVLMVAVGEFGGLKRVVMVALVVVVWDDYVDVRRGLGAAWCAPLPCSRKAACGGAGAAGCPRVRGTAGGRAASCAAVVVEVVLQRRPCGAGCKWAPLVGSVCSG